MKMQIPRSRRSKVIGISSLIQKFPLRKNEKIDKYTVRYLPNMQKFTELKRTLPKVCSLNKML